MCVCACMKLCLILTCKECVIILTLVFIFKVCVFIIIKLMPYIKAYSNMLW